MLSPGLCLYVCRIIVTLVLVFMMDYAILRDVSVLMAVNESMEVLPLTVLVNYLYVLLGTRGGTILTALTPHG